MCRTFVLLLLSAGIARAQTAYEVNRWFYEAERGDAGAAFWLGVAYDQGKGVTQNSLVAVRWFLLSANLGNAEAQNALGQMFEEGRGITRDDAQAAKWYQTACEHRPDYGGAGQGCNNLGLLYLDGHGVPQNRLEAYKYFRLSGTRENLEYVMSKMTSDEILEAEKQTQNWLQAHPEN